MKNEINAKTSKPNRQHGGKGTNKRGPSANRNQSSNYDSKRGTNNSSGCSAFNSVVDHKSNDPAWYVINTDMARDVASLPLGIPAGSPLKNVPTETQPGGIRFPGIMVMPYHPRFGDGGNSASNSLNIASQNFFAYMVHINSGSRTYEHPDLFMAMGAIESLYLLLAEARRAYGVAQVYARQNRYYGKALLKALNWDPDDVLNNMARFRVAINNAALRVSAFPMPTGFDFMTRHIWMSSKLWKDHDGVKAQIYAYRLSHYLQWNATAMETGSALEYVSLGDTPHTIDSFFAKLNEAIDILWNDTDISIICRDIMHSFDVGQLTVPDQLPEDYVVIPEFDVNVRNQITNLVTTGSDMLTMNADGDSVKAEIGWVWQQEGVILSDIRYTNTTKSPLTGSILNFSEDGAEPTDIIVATRLNLRVDEVTYDEDEDRYYTKYAGIGSDAVESFEVWTLTDAQDNGDGKPLYANRYIFNSEIGSLQISANPRFYLRVLADLEKFAYHPRVYYFNGDSLRPEPYDSLISIAGDVNAYCELPVESLRLMSQMATLKEFTPAVVGNYNPVNRF